MSQTQHLVLFTGTDCHLCELAKNLLNSVSPELNIKEVNVKQQREYFHEYGARIPVLKKEPSNQELPWPFDPEQLLHFLQN